MTAPAPAFGWEDSPHVEAFDALTVLMNWLYHAGVKGSFSTLETYAAAEPMKATLAALGVVPEDGDYRYQVAEPEPAEADRVGPRIPNLPRKVPPRYGDHTGEGKGGQQ
jgi:hypothetical protein